jgi:hypothetical protein
MGPLDAIQQLTKAIEAGNYDAAPSTLTQGGALQIEDLSAAMNNVTFENTHIKLQKMVTVTSCKSTLAQFDRQLSYGIFGGSAQMEGNVGQEETSDFVRITVPMAFYSHTRRVTIASTMVATVDGKKSDERAASDAAIKLAGDIEFDLFRGLDDFSNAGVFDGNPLVVPALPNIHGLGLQVRQSDFQVNARDQMFSEFGSDDSVVISVGGVLTQSAVEDAAVRSALNFGTANRLMVDPIVLSGYNKIVFGKERIILAGSPQDALGGDIRKQWVSGGTVNIEASQFLRGKSKPSRPRQNSNAPIAPSFTVQGTGATAGTTSDNVIYYYYVSAANEIGESALSGMVPTMASTSISSVGSTAAAIAKGDKLTLVITTGGGTDRFYNVYRGLTATTTKFIGRVVRAASGTTTFVDLFNKLPGSVTGFLVQGDTMEVKELAPYSRIKLAVTDLSQPEAHFRFLCLASTQPRKNVLVANLAGTYSGSYSADSQGGW